MRTIARFMDARNTAEGKFLSVLLSVLLVFSFLNVTMFTDYAGANPNEGEDVSLPAEEPGLTEPGAAAEEPEAEKASEEVTTPAPAEEKQEASVEEEPAATDVEVEPSSSTRRSFTTALITATATSWSRPSARISSSQ